MGLSLPKVNFLVMSMKMRYGLRTRGRALFKLIGDVHIGQTHRQIDGAHCATHQWFGVQTTRLLREIVKSVLRRRFWSVSPP